MARKLLAQIKVCPTCGKQYRPWVKQQVRCSRECYDQSRQRPMVKCAGCSKEFRPKQRGVRFCGASCAMTWVAHQRPNTRGWYRTTKGYVLTWAPKHPQASRQGYVMQHRLVMEQMLGRPLLPAEVVHHKNGIKDDNRPENLELMGKREHDGHRNPRYMATCPCCGHIFPVRGNAHTVEANSS